MSTKLLKISEISKRFKKFIYKYGKKKLTPKKFFSE